MIILKRINLIFLLGEVIIKKEKFSIKTIILQEPRLVAAK